MHFFFPKLLGLLACALPLVAGQTCENPQVRKEWRTLSTAERKAWISAVKCLGQLPHSDSLSPTVNPNDIPPVNTTGSFYDDFVYVHMDLNSHIHNTGLFLPWHRYYVHQYDLALKEKCGYKGASPYWDWTKDSKDFANSEMFQDSDPESGLGGWGNVNNDIQVPDGGFSDFKLSYPSYHTLRRNFTAQPWLPFAGFFLFPEPDAYAVDSFTPEIIAEDVNGHVGDFKGFQLALEASQASHGAVHLIMGGDLGGGCPKNAYKGCKAGPTWSANEPLFWMHHAMVDKIWYDWQNKNSSNFWAFEGGSVQKMSSAEEINEYPNGGAPYLTINSTMPTDGLFVEQTIYNVMNTTGGYLCYTYA